MNVFMLSIDITILYHRKIQIWLSMVQIATGY